jgi:hypothetical protein
MTTVTFLMVSYGTMWGRTDVSALHLVWKNILIPNMLLPYVFAVARNYCKS